MSICIVFVTISLVLVLGLSVIALGVRDDRKYDKVTYLICTIIAIIGAFVIGFELISLTIEEAQQTYTFITIDGKEKTNGHYCDSNSMTCRVGDKVYQVKEFEANKQE
ncbi:MAG: hypothetical protein RSC93_02595 [Erysipelotrichaceae bacterium]